jgi:hypothetical protein
MKPLVLLASLTWLVITPLGADTLYQTTAQGKQLVIQRDAIVVQEDSSALVYKHFDLKERRVVKVRLNKGSLAYSVVTSSLPERQQSVANWRRFGYTATVTDETGKTTRVADAYVDFYPPGGRGSLLESVPAKTALTLALDPGGTDEIEFANLDRVVFLGDRVRATLRNGRVEEGKVLKPTNQPVEPRLLGITDRYDPASEEVFDFSLPLVRLKEIRFEP